MHSSSVRITNPTGDRMKVVGMGERRSWLVRSAAADKCRGAGCAQAGGSGG
jgi:hypothetical protein